MITVDGIVSETVPMWRSVVTDDKPDGWRTRLRSDPPDTIIMHWTGGEGGAEHVMRTLARRRLSVHFIIDPSGTIWQCEDPAHTVCLHASGWNDRSVGIEVVNYGWRRGSVPRAGAARPRYTTAVHGWSFRAAGFHRCQEVAAMVLCDALIDRLPIPRLIHTVPRVLSDEESRRGGVMGHYHVARKKVDPAPELMWRIKGGVGEECGHV